MSAFNKPVLKRDLGSGHSFLDRSEPNSLYELMKSIADAHANKVCNGLMTTAPTTPSTQATGTGTTAWRVNVDKGVTKVGGVAKEFAAQADFVVVNAGNTLANGQSIVAAIVAKNVAGTVTMVPVLGAAATTGAQVAPTDAQIATAVGQAGGVINPWVKIAEVTLNRTGDLTVTQSQDNSKADYAAPYTVE